MTIKLYDDFPYETKFSSHVVSCTPCNKGYDVILEKTLFFPEEGGQTCDKGTLNGIEVLDVQIINDEIHHYVSQELNGEINGEIDFFHRYFNMQNHTGEHILSGIIHQLYGLNNVGFHLGEHEITSDYDGVLTYDQLKEIEKIVNLKIIEDKKVICEYPDNVLEIQYRSKKEIDGAIRIVTIEDTDVCACCAPHVKSTREVGLLKILKVIKYKKGIRVYFVCGYRAYLDYQQKHDQVTNIMALLSSQVENMSEHVQRILDENNALKQQLSSLKKDMILKKCEQLEEEEYHIVFEEELDSSMQQYYFNQLTLKSQKMTALFIKNNETYRFIIGSNDDARNYLNELKNHFIVRGGGKKDMVQGSIEGSMEEILSVLERSV